MASLDTYIGTVRSDILKIIPDSRSFVEEHLFQVFFLPDEKLNKVKDLLQAEIDKRLHPDADLNDPFTFYPSFVEQVPDGSENGKYLAIDLGGTKCRTLVVDVNNKTTSQNIIEETIPMDYIRDESASNLFDYIADQLHRLLTDCKLLNTPTSLKLGFTFSFPVKQLAVDKAEVINWTKHYKCSDLIGKDVVDKLEDSIRKRGEMNVKCTAVINDTIGTLITGAFIDPHCSIGLISGTGTNGCCFEPVKNIREYRNTNGREEKMVAIDTRWNNFGYGDVIDFLMSEYDREITRDTVGINMGIEKLMCGMFIGENVRRVLHKMYTEGISFTSWKSWPSQWKDVFSLDTSVVSDILSHPLNGMVIVNKYLSKFNIDNLPENDCRLLYRVCELVVIRAGHVTAACVACLVQRVGKEVIGVAVDGSVFKHTSLYRDVLNDKANTLVDHKQKVYFVPCNDGSGLGAALIAAMMDKSD
ncbi:hypothetical protein ACF0H5_009818 [Mactra antiquata]